jgi:uncharacterized protein (TIGR03067 family)
MMSLRYLRRILLAVVAFLMAGYAPIKDLADLGEEDLKLIHAEEDIQLLQGTWVLVRLEVGAKEVSLKPDDETYLIIKKNKLTMGNNNNVSLSGTLRVDATNDPKWFDVQRDGPTCYGIYSTESKDVLTICFGVVGWKDRPTAFTTKGQWLGYTLHRFRRVKPVSGGTGTRGDVTGKDEGRRGAKAIARIAAPPTGPLGGDVAKGTRGVGASGLPQPRQGHVTAGGGTVCGGLVPRVRRGGSDATGDMVFARPVQPVVAEDARPASA